MLAMLSKGIHMARILTARTSLPSVGDNGF
jgi:hypothetical protein